MNKDAFDNLVNRLLDEHEMPKRRLAESILANPQILDDLLRVLSSDEIVEDWPEGDFIPMGEIPEE